MEFIITDKLIIQDMEDVKNRLSYLSGQEIDLEKMKDFIINEKSTVFYFDNKLNGKSEDAPGVLYAWLDSGYVSKTGGHPIFVSLLKTDDCFVGHFVGNAKVLSGTIIDYYPQNARSINNNLSRFPLKYDKKISKREVKHIPISETVITTSKDEQKEQELTPLVEKIKNAGIHSPKQKLKKSRLFPLKK